MAKSRKGIPRPNFNWTEEAIQLLGTTIDREVASKLGISTGAVALKRKKLGIASYKPSWAPIKIPPALERQLGKKTDAEIADALGVSQTGVASYRRRLGIQATLTFGELPAEADELIGKIPDSHIAERYGVSHTCVNRRRYKLGITKAPPIKKATRITCITLPASVVEKLGKMPDSVLAKEAGVHASTITKYRKLAGIETYVFTLPAEGEALLGVKSDAYIASKYGTSITTIVRIRVRKGIGAFVPQIRTKLPEELVARLGKCKDEEIAALSPGWSSSKVARYRLGLGIPAYKAPSLAADQSC